MMSRLGSPGARPLVAALVIALAGCASAGQPVPASPAVKAVEGVQRIVVVASGESKFAVVRSGKDPAQELEAVLRWFPYGAIAVPIARTVYRVLTWLFETERASGVLPRDVTPASVVATAFARSLQRIGPFDHIVVTDREPAGDTRRTADAVVRVTVPSWGLVPLRDGESPVVAGFADVRARMVRQDTGAAMWEHDEDVTHPERLPLDALTRDRAQARERLVEVLERAGRRLASELIYARSARP
jgi:hypothetical protein